MTPTAAATAAAVKWDADYGVPLGNCSAVSGEDGKFVRHFSKATVMWDCRSGTGSITPLL